MSSATFTVRGGFMAMNITFRNTAGAIKQQAVAVLNMADLSTFFSCSVEAYQDTLYAHSLRQFYRDCDIYGTVDFIFGNAAAVFQNNNFYARLPMKGQFNPSLLKAEQTQIKTRVFQSIIVQLELLMIWLQAISHLVEPAGWHDWNGDFGLDTLYYAEYNNRGLCLSSSFYPRLGSRKKNGKTWHPKKKHINKSVIYESMSRRKLIHIGKDEQVLVREMVVVNKNGGGNFTTINDAINAAPNNSAASDGYFLIYVTAGVYQEYLSIATNKPYLLMIEDGINQTNIYIYI
ncbi:putative pectinesterase/pectinesterase inhibitor 41 [Quercus suber]|uniref:Pectinesterase n=1 Tax=Quercus suber TaxID=58331 RepID=A0AAW0L220_QUESU